VVADVQLIAGVEFVTVSNNDTSFAKWVSGTAHGLRKCTFIDSLKRMRTAASVDECVGKGPAEQVFFEGTTLSAYATKKKVRESANRGEVPAYVTITLPSFCNGDMVDPAMPAKVLPSFDTKHSLSIELTVVAMAHLCGAMRAANTNHVALLAREKIQDGLWWLVDKKVFHALKYDADCDEPARMRVRQTFKPASDTDDSIQAAKDAALTWIGAVSEDSPSAGAGG